MTAPQLDERVLRALLDRLIPADDYPGGWDAGCGTYIIRLLAGDGASLAETVAVGLRELDDEARIRHGSGFADLASERQDVLLADAERGVVHAAWQADAPAFIRLIAELAAEGYYSDPSSGGNRGGISWTMIGYPGAVV